MPAGRPLSAGQTGPYVLQVPASGLRQGLPSQLVPFARSPIVGRARCDSSLAARQMMVNVATTAANPP